MPSSCRIAEKLLVWTLRNGGGPPFVGEPGSAASLANAEGVPLHPLCLIGSVVRRAGVFGVAMFFSFCAPKAPRQVGPASGVADTGERVSQRQESHARSAHDRYGTSGRIA